MDYQKAIKEAEIQIDMYEGMILYNKDFEPKNDNSNYERKLDFLKTAISAMQELEEYHKTGLSPEQVSDTICELSATKRILGHYKQLGTLEEVREAVEKQKAKKPKTRMISGDIEWWCPNCGESHIMFDSKKGFRYCHHCGQHMDWSVEE